MATALPRHTSPVEHLALHQSPDALALRALQATAAVTGWTRHEGLTDFVLTRRRRCRGVPPHRSAL